MKNTIFKRSTINVAISATLFASGVTTAQANDEITVEQKSAIETIVVTANRTPQEQFSVLSATAVIDQEQIKLLQHKMLLSF